MTQFSASRKGQSAIEYLMTYGWMLLVVAIVGGAVITTVQSSQDTCQKQINNFDATERAFGVSEFTVTSDNLNIQFKNNERETVTINKVNVSTTDGTQVKSVTSNTDLTFGDTTTVTVDNINQSDNCNTFDVAVGYNKGDGDLPGELTGSIKGQMAQQ